LTAIAEDPVGFDLHAHEHIAYVQVQLGVTNSHQHLVHNLRMGETSHGWSTSVKEDLLTNGLDVVGGE